MRSLRRRLSPQIRFDPPIRFKSLQTIVSMLSGFKLSFSIVLAASLLGFMQSPSAASGLSAIPNSVDRLAPYVATNTLVGSSAAVLVPATEVEIPSGNPLTDPLRFTAPETLLFSDTANGKLNSISLVEAAMIAGGLTNPNSIQRYQAKYAALREKLLQRFEQFRADQAGDPILARIEFIHQTLYRNLLTGGYSAEATDLAATFDTGIYNCASATLLFVSLAGDIDLDAQAIELPGHVRAVIETSDHQYEIEATCPVWPDAVRAEPRIQSAGASDHPYNLRRAGMPSIGREVSPLGLLAMIYYNRGVDAFSENRFADSIAVTRRALLLDPDNRLAYGNLLAAVNNWALALGDRGNFNDAQTLLNEGRQLDPAHLPFIHNAEHLRQLQLQSAKE
ncbi:MAG TPA: hypothetical protein VGI75_00255 [Pirellulales bacterium]